MTKKPQRLNMARDGPMGLRRRLCGVRGGAS